MRWICFIRGNMDETAQSWWAKTCTHEQNILTTRSTDHLGKKEHCYIQKYNTLFPIGPNRTNPFLYLRWICFILLNFNWYILFYLFYFQLRMDTKVPLKKNYKYLGVYVLNLETSRVETLVSWVQTLPTEIDSHPVSDVTSVACVSIPSTLVANVHRRVDEYACEIVSLIYFRINYR